MSDPLHQHLLAALAATPSAPLCVAFSGGPDSTALLHALSQLSEVRTRGLRALHVDHGLHADSAAWAEHCQRFCATLALPCDVSDSAAVQAAIAKIGDRFGRLDALVNNAGIAMFKPLLDTTDDDWNRVLAVNLTGPFLCTKAAAPVMREHGGGAIVNITSISAVRASTLRTAYGTSKAGLAHLTKQFAVELASLGIRVNGVAPGPVETDLLPLDDGLRGFINSKTALGRVGQPADIAKVVAFLASDVGGWITGEVIGASGGLRI